MAATSQPSDWATLAVLTERLYDLHGQLEAAEADRKMAEIYALEDAIAATEAELGALAGRFDLVALGRLAAEVEMVRESSGVILLRASFEAAFVQSCVVTLDPVEGAVAGNFMLRYGPPEAETDQGAGDDVAFEPLIGDVIDIGEAVAQEFSLALPSFPRRLGAVLEIEEGPPEAGPFAALSRLADRQEP